MAQETVYIKPEADCKVLKPHITISDVMKVECSDVGTMRQIRQMELYRFAHPHSVVFSILVVIERIHRDYPNLEVVNCGESDFVVEYVQEKQKSKVLECVKIMAVTILVFFGSAFTIMAFHNDIDIQGVIERFYLQVMGSRKPKISVLEISYALGIGVGIVVFYNHISKKKLTKDPTPIEVELKKYNKDLDMTKVDLSAEKGHKIDVT